MKLKYIFLTVLFSVVAFVLPVWADSDEVDDLQDKIDKYEEKIEELHGKAKTLSEEIEYMNSQISLTELRIQNSIQSISKTEKKIQDLANDIEDLRLRIEKLEGAIDYQKDVLSSRMRERYKSKDDTAIMVLFGSDTLNTLVQKTEYLKIMERHDNELITQLGDTKDAFEVQKTLFTEKKEEEESLKRQLEVEKANLDSYRTTLEDQKSAKESLLEQTQNDEEKYQELLSQARAELLAIEGIVSSIDFEDGEDVDKGDAIAIMGNSGYPYCSTGAHLHFEVRKNNSVQNPEKYLKSKNVFVYDYSSGYKTIGSGDWSWPMSDVTVTQRYGQTPWSWRYPSGLHSGIDMVSDNVYIKAPEDGVAVKGGQSCYGAVINYVAIDHGDGVVSYYLHVK